jgi:hypothetical protein
MACFAKYERCSTRSARPCCALPPMPPDWRRIREAMDVLIDEAGVRYSKKRNRTRTMTCDADECIRRFLMRILPKGFDKIRCLGFLANRHRLSWLSLCRQSLNTPPPEVHLADLSTSVLFGRRSAINAEIDRKLEPLVVD